VPSECLNHHLIFAKLEDHPNRHRFGKPASDETGCGV